MDPRDFLSTAALLNNETDEHHLRTSISRSYYAVHLHIRDFITSIIKKKIKTDVHKYILKCCYNCESKDIQAIGCKLSTLLTYRTDADYRMNLNITATKSQDVYDDATELLADFESKIAINTNRQKLSQSSIQQARQAGFLI